MIAITTTRNNSGTVHYFTTGADDFAGIEALADYDYAELGEAGAIVTRTGNGEGAARVTARRYLDGVVCDEVVVDYLLIG